MCVGEGGEGRGVGRRGEKYLGQDFRDEKWDSYTFLFRQASFEVYNLGSFDNDGDNAEEDAL